MNPIEAIYCRTVQAILRAALPVLPYREPEIFRMLAALPFPKSIADKQTWLEPPMGCQPYTSRLC